MAMVAQEQLSRSLAGASGSRPLAGASGMWGVVLLGLLALSGGCVLLDSDKSESLKPPPPGDAFQVIATWQNHVQFTPDPTRAGEPGPGLAGRLYLFGKQIDFPLTGKGQLVVDLFDESSGEAVLQEEWRIDPITLDRLLRKDVLGWGYTLFLPWKNYRPDICKIRMRCRYEPDKGAPLFCETPVTLASENGVMRPGQTPLTTPLTSQMSTAKK
jgi:hypothetical protein